ncbi:TRAP transporter small permease subunit [Shinella sp. 838]|uniref:TRAP transporter small permease n=1 Tax=Shinella sp. 838 TaxID=3038164 RepID=UPI002415739B|nr:TRAP transporter small permease subunit [Shinella sp. 838]MDG4674894.1 TRAP transporter small permease subunit [Shinella sp. 838]
MDYRANYPQALWLLSGLVDLCLMAGGFSILALVFCNAALRGFAGFDLAWSLEVTSFLLLWTTFLGCAAAIARGAHMRVTEIAEGLFPGVGLRILNLVINAIVAGLLLLLIVIGWQISQRTWDQTTTVLYWPMGLLYASMPAGMALSLIFHMFNFYIEVRQPVMPHGAHSDGGEALS